ncbi:MAG: hypothetical protein A2149_09625 [Candidatus Schekmanbacteria bacterium RBG_16_38_11]|uniref:DUF2065 domain-containing protein n=2 Tax=Candidatus Schekmaniibacteriota TaxID=1817811 RepID=A0A1F7RJJ6_9BACT|nr:MAG: hypothetical protein A2042_04370 [Candidatus Schekmanbacteria bacterium GWA2_38_11]OGL45255.1 MAG: hypothetical protein A2149_09625 [Candidatus Schekmanbacteria bacterium RBG_16_38_11]
MEPIVIAIGIVLIIEGLPYFCIPDQVKEISKKIQEIKSSSLRIFGISIMILGLILVYVARRYIPY